jgi:hypothetical protein
MRKPPNAFSVISVVLRDLRAHFFAFLLPYLTRYPHSTVTLFARLRG